MYFASGSKLALADGSEVALGVLLQRHTDLDESPSIRNPFGSEQGVIVGACDDLDAVLVTLRDGRAVVCTPESRMSLAGGPGFCTPEDWNRYPVLTASGPAEIISVQPVGRRRMIGVSAPASHAVLIDGVWFLT